MSGIRKPNKIAVFISGNGSTLQALLEMHYQFDISLIITSKENPLGALKAKRYGKSVIFLNKEMSFDQLSVNLKKHRINLIILAGFMKMLPASFVNQWAGQIYNIHPSLLPAFPGLHSIEQNYHAKLNMGVTIHQVNEEMDQGRIVLQQEALSAVKTNVIDLPQANIFIRRTEQHLLREFAIRRTL